MGAAFVAKSGNTSIACQKQNSKLKAFRMHMQEAYQQ